ncbi:glycosyltransferase family 4 protein [Mucilaginibacter sp. 21P]|uniref:glycosyltransferase family 4 protein n=1 Tax=Mucilaginibacter sp. 21P TaxID=2778902 RepID=UPI001C5779D5|nr:glycosyltransferase family 4 protein [Mucilaginibacter sp. 21P]QXV67504.1 glycosyltransferase family 4 protein [Mucilaginibacter sp. 21P]
MRLGYISFEHPLGQRGGGIGTYVDQVATIMAQRGHDIHVFTGFSGTAYSTKSLKNYVLHLVPAKSIDVFRLAVIPFFEQANDEKPFDAIESAEYGADGISIKKKHFKIPLVVKLHTPSFLVKQLNFTSPSFTTKARFITGAIVRGRMPKLYWKEQLNHDIEKEIYLLADKVSSPSKSLAEIVANKWGHREITIIPNPYVPPAEIHSLNISQEKDVCRVLFLGRLEKRKGIYYLLAAIPQIIEVNPNIIFHFVGSDQPSYKDSLTVRSLMEKRLHGYKKHLKFDGFIENQQLHNVFSESDLCIFPSLWENFPNVCLEAMAAGRAVIGTNNGGMAEMIDHLKDGYLIEPNSPAAITNAILALAGNPLLRLKLGTAARKKVLANYNAEVIGSMTEQFYLQVQQSPSLA